MISIAGFFTPSGSPTGKVFNFCTNKDYIMMTKEQEAKLKALQSETAMYNALAEQMKKMSEEMEREFQETKAETVRLKLKIEAKERENAFLKEYLRNEVQRLKNRS